MQSDEGNEWLRRASTEGQIWRFGGALQNGGQAELWLRFQAHSVIWYGVQWGYMGKVGSVQHHIEKSSTDLQHRCPMNGPEVFLRGGTILQPGSFDGGS